MITCGLNSHLENHREPNSTLCIGEYRETGSVSRSVTLLVGFIESGEKQEMAQVPGSATG